MSSIKSEQKSAGKEARPHVEPLVHNITTNMIYVDCNKSTFSFSQEGGGGGGVGLYILSGFYKKLETLDMIACAVVGQLWPFTGVMQKSHLV